jgi:CxxC-x17-CxxC domain-containing protein
MAFALCCAPSKSLAPAPGTRAAVARRAAPNPAVTHRPLSMVPTVEPVFEQGTHAVSPHCSQHQPGRMPSACSSRTREVPILSTDMSLQCRDCGQTFLFTAGEQEFYASRGLMNQPSRCPECRAARKAATGGGGYAGDRAPRKMYLATCADCGQPTQVPFQPRDNRPVYCSNCFQQHSSGDRYERRC